MTTNVRQDSFATGTDALMATITNNASFCMTNPFSMTCQDDLASLLQLPLDVTTEPINLEPSMIDNWLADELQRSGILTKPELLQTTPVDLFGQSPSLAATPAQDQDGSISSGNSVASIKSPGDQFAQQNTNPNTPLFPDIQAWLDPKPSSVPSPVTVAQPVGGVPVQQRSLRPVPILPKTESMASDGGMPNLALASGKRKSMMSDNEQDVAMLKRQRNTDAARRSRQKKLAKMAALEKRVSELEGDNSRLTTRIAVLESEKSGLEAKDKELQERIRALEDQLTQAHKDLTAKCTHN